MAESLLDGVEVDWKLGELRAMVGAGEPVLRIAQRLSEKYDLAAVGPETIMTDREYAAYKSATNDRRWGEADAMYANVLSASYPTRWSEMLDGEGWARAFNAVRNDELAKISALWRRMDLREVPSYEGGTFESRMEKDGGRRGYMALSMYDSPYFGVRLASMRVPIDGIVRRVVKPVVYTALPRTLQPFQERIDDAKEIRHAGETECRMPDGTRVPGGTTIKISFD